MEPTDDRPGELISARPQAAARLEPDTVAMPRVSPHPAAPVTLVSPVPANAAELAGMLLPTEHVSFGTSPHPVIFVRPVLETVVVLIALTVALGWETHPIVRGHHVTIPLLTGLARTAVLVVAGLAVLRAIVALAQRLIHYLGFRVVTTNRRVFVVQGFFGRHVTPIGNTALAGATMSQSFLGRLLNYGDVVMPLASSGPGTIRTIREPVQLYRELEAVANGVDGETWQQPIRQTIIP
jgi:hypothetical protein